MPRHRNHVCLLSMSLRAGVNQNQNIWSNVFYHGGTFSSWCQVVLLFTFGDLSLDYRISILLARITAGGCCAHGKTISFKPAGGFLWNWEVRNATTWKVPAPILISEFSMHRVDDAPIHITTRVLGMFICIEYMGISSTLSFLDYFSET